MFRQSSSLTLIDKQSSKIYFFICYWIWWTPFKYLIQSSFELSKVYSASKNILSSAPSIIWCLIHINPREQVWTWSAIFLSTVRLWFWKESREYRAYNHVETKKNGILPHEDTNCKYFFPHDPQYNHKMQLLFHLRRDHQLEIKS